MRPAKNPRPWMKDARSAKDLTQAEVASAVGVTISTYQAWESGVSVPYARHRRALSEVLGIDVRANIDREANPFAVDRDSHGAVA